MSHADFLALAYGLTAVLLLVEPLFVWRRHRAARRALARDTSTGVSP